MKNNKYIIILFVLFTALVVFEYLRPKGTDWSASFKKDDKIPFGSYILYDLLPDIFINSSIQTNEKSPYTTFHNKEFTNTSYIIITSEFKPAKVSLNALLNFVKQGNRLFISALQFSNNFKDSLHFTNKLYYSSIFKNDSLNYNFFNENLKTDSGYFIKSANINFYIDSVNIKHAKKIAYTDNKKLNFFRQKYGKGEFFIHNQPFAFTNYNTLNDSVLIYALKSIAYADNKTIIWDEFYKPGRINHSPMSYILSKQSLRIAWYLIIALATIFLLFGSKRKQRVVPVIEKPANSSLDFANTLANLYLSHKNHKDIAQKKYSYWLNFLRSKFYIKIEPGDKLNISLIAEKTTVNKDLVMKINTAINNINNQKTINSETLLYFNKLLDDFYANCDYQHSVKLKMKS